MTDDREMVQILPANSHPFTKSGPARLATPIPAQVVAFCPLHGSALDPAIDRLASHGVRVATFPLRQLPLDWFDRYATSFDIALIDTDFLGDKVEMIDFGMRLRRFAPDLPIVMLSSRIASSDRSTERMAFCDVTLRLPAQEDELFESLSIALENHAYWRDSRYETRLLAPRKPRASASIGDGGAFDDRDDSPPDW